MPESEYEAGVSGGTRTINLDLFGSEQVYLRYRRGDTCLVIVSNIVYVIRNFPQIESAALAGQHERGQVIQV